MVFPLLFNFFFQKLLNFCPLKRSILRLSNIALYWLSNTFSWLPTNQRRGPAFSLLQAIWKWLQITFFTAKLLKLWNQLFMCVCSSYALLFILHCFVLFLESSTYIVVHLSTMVCFLLRKVQIVKVHSTGERIFEICSVFSKFTSYIQMCKPYLFIILV